MSSNSLRLTLIGATGGTGSHLLQHALDAGHHVTALVRTPSKLAINHDHLTVVEGSVLDPAAAEQAVRGADAVLCLLGAPPSSRARVRESGTRALIDAMVVAGTRRLIVQSSHGIGDTSHELPWVMRWVIVPFYLKRAFADHEAQEAVVRASGLDWTLVRPPGLTDANPAPALAHGPAFDPSRMTMSIARADVASFLLAQATAPFDAPSTLVVSTASRAA